MVPGESDFCSVKQLTSVFAFWKQRLIPLNTPENKSSLRDAEMIKHEEGRKEGKGKRSRAELKASPTL